MCTSNNRSKHRYRGIDGVHVGVNSCMNMSGHLEGFSYREAHPCELNASGRGMSGKLDKMTGCSKWITWSEKFLKKAYRAFSSWNIIELEGVEEEEKKPRWIKFLEGTNFFGAMTRRLNVREREREREKTEYITEHKAHERRRKATCNAW